jgi:hypothetical protein
MRNGVLDRLDGTCGSAAHLSRRAMLGWAGAAGLAWLTPFSRMLAREAESAPRGRPARSLILLWMAGGPSQLETFDPHPGKRIAAGTTSIRTSMKGVEFGAGMVQAAGWMDRMTLVRSVMSKEADHERAVYAMKTGYRPSQTVVHPSIGAVVCHQLEDAGMDIPRHISIVPGGSPARGGYLGAEFDAFQVRDPKGPIQDIHQPAMGVRMDRRMEDLTILERGFARGRPADLETGRTVHRASMERALRMMGSEQLTAFDLERVPESEKAAYGDSAFGRGCLAALRLIEAGVRCVEVTLDGWDTHVNNHGLQGEKIRVLDPAFAALMRDLEVRGLMESTVVMCGGEFGRTPKLNPLEGRDHWPYGFSVMLAGGGFRRGYVKGSTDPEGESREPGEPVTVADVHATIQRALGIDPERELKTPVGRLLALSEGRVIGELLGG